MTGRREEETKELSGGEVKEKEMEVEEEQQDETRVLYYKERGRQVRRTWHRDTSRVTFLFSKVPGKGRRRGGPQRRYFGGIPEVSKDGPPRVDKENPVRPVDCCRWSPRMERTRLRLPRVYAHVNPDSRASFHKFLPADVLPRITARRFTAKPRVGKIVFTASGYTYGSYEDEEERSAGDGEFWMLEATGMTSRWESLCHVRSKYRLAPHWQKLGDFCVAPAKNSRY